jgi:hypothetical protein
MFGREKRKNDELLNGEEVFSLSTFSVEDYINFRLALTEFLLVIAMTLTLNGLPLHSYLNYVEAACITSSLVYLTTMVRLGYKSSFPLVEYILMARGIMYTFFLLV